MADWEFDRSISSYTNLTVKNFRGFSARQKMPFAPLTFLLGPNSSGKSSIFDALLLLSQSRFEPLWIGSQQPRWIGPLVDLGSFKDTVFGHKIRLPIEIEVEYYSPSLHKSQLGRSFKPDINILFTLRTSLDDPIGYLSKIQLTDIQSKAFITLNYSKTKTRIELLGEKITHSLKEKIASRKDDLLYQYRRSYYSLRNTIDNVIQEQSPHLIGHNAAWKRIVNSLSLYNSPISGGVERVTSGRGAPRRWYSLAELTRTPSFLRYNIESPTFSDVNPQMLSELPSVDRLYTRKAKKRPEITIASVLKQLNIASEIRSSVLSPYHNSINVVDNVTGITSNLIDVGYGASQVIPVIRACMSTSIGPLFVEQPEIHLHPKAQSTLAELLCQTSTFRQVVVETHSVHMINRARILVAEGKLDPNHVVINLIARTPKGSTVYPMRILKNGDFATKWPPGYDFFDERYQDTMQLLKLKHING